MTGTDKVISLSSRERWQSTVLCPKSISANIEEMATGKLILFVKKKVRDAVAT